MPHDGKVYREGAHGEHGCHKDLSRQHMAGGTFAERHRSGPGQQPQAPSANMHNQYGRIGHWLFLEIIYVDWCPGVSPHRSQVPLQHLGLLDGQRRGRSCRFQRTAAKGFSMRSPAIFWPGFKSSERRRVAPLLTAAATMSASQKPIRDSSSIRNATESSAGVVSMHQIE